MTGKVEKARAISDAKILFVSLVDKAANRHRFLITKSKGDSREFRTYGKILKTDPDTHYVTGIVYEPMVEDTDGEYMTEEEVTKAAHWFLKNSGEADIQHCFQKAAGVEVVESYVAKADMEIEGQPIKKGTWLMTMEVSNDEIWDRIEKGEITGFSMGGQGVHSQIDDDISETVEKKERVGILKRLGQFLGVDVVEKGTVRENYASRVKEDNFWAAYYSLSDYLLHSFNPESGEWDGVDDETVIRDALEDFNEIVTDILTRPEEAAETIEKAARELGTKDVQTLQNVYESLGYLAKQFDDKEKEEITMEVTKAELEEIVTDAVAKAMASEAHTSPDMDSKDPDVGLEGETVDGVQKAATGQDEAITWETVEKMVQDTVAKAMKPQKEALTLDAVQEMIDKAVADAVNPVLKSSRLSTNLGDEGDLEKGAKPKEEHYLHGLL